MLIKNLNAVETKLKCLDFRIGTNPTAGYCYGCNNILLIFLNKERNSNDSIILTESLVRAEV